MKDHNPAMQILVGVSVTVLSAFLIYVLGIKDKESSSAFPSQNWSVQEQEPVLAQPVASTPAQGISVKIVDNLSLDQYGYGQVAEAVTIDIDGQISQINLSAMNGTTSGSAEFQLPGEGFYRYEIKTSTTLNNLDASGRLYTIYGYGEGSIRIKDGQVFQMMMDASTIGNRNYKLYLEEM